jgi:peptidyl-prolyl cis-trans isomerase B (cyclophilin B)
VDLGTFAWDARHLRPTAPHRTLTEKDRTMSYAFALCGLLSFADKPDFEKDTLPSTRDMPEKSINGKSMKELKTKVAELWPTVVFEKDGKKVEYLVTFETELGDVEISFFPDKAPTHVRSFVALAKAGYYDGLKFHRCIEGFMIQGGCPAGNGAGGPGYALKAEFNRIEHERGILSMARTKNPNSGGSQFFLCVDRAPHLDNKYSVFGKVTKGMDVVDKIVTAPKIDDQTPANPVKIKKAKVTVKGEKPAEKN